MAADGGEVRVRITGDVSNLKNAVSEGKLALSNFQTGTTKGLDNISKGFTSAGKTLTTGLTLPLAGVGAVAVNEFLKFDAAMSKTQAISGMTSEEIAGLGESAKAMAADSIYSADEVATGMYWIADSTTTAADIQNYMAAAMNLATASGADLGDTAQTLQTTMYAYGASSDEAAKYSDVLATAFRNSMWEGSEFNTAMSYVAATASQLGIPIESTSAALTVLSQKGYEASTAGSQLRSGLLSLINPTSKARETLEKYGLSLDDVNPEVVGFEQALLNLKDANISTADSALIFGEVAAGPMSALIGEADGALADMTEEMNNSGGAAQEMADVIEQSASGQVKTFINDLKTMAIEIGAALIPALRSVIDAIKPVVEWFKNLSPAAQKMIVTIGLVVAAIGPALLIIGKLAGSISTLIKTFRMLKELGSIIGILGKFGGAFKTMMGAIKMGLNFLVGHPIILAIVLIIALIWLLYDNWELVWSYLEPIWNTIKEVGEAIFNALVEFFTGLWDGLVAIWNTVWSAISSFFETIWGGIKLIAEFIWGLIIAYFTNLWNGLVAIWEGIWWVIENILVPIWEGIKMIAEFIWNALVSFFTTLWDTLVNIWNTVWNTIKTVGETIWNIILAVVTTIWNLIKTVIDTVMNIIRTIIETAWNVIKGIFDVVLGIIRFIVEDVFGRIRDTIMTIMGAIRDWIMTAWDFIKSRIQIVMDIISNIISTVWNTIKNVIDTVVGGIKNIIDTGFGWIKNTIDTVMNTIKNIMDRIWGTIKGIVQGAVDFIMGLIRPLIDAVGSLANIAGGIGDFVGGIGSALGFAEGGFVKARPGGTLAVVGEGKEDEYIVPASKMETLLNSRISAGTIGIIGEGGGGGNNIYVQGYDPIDVVNKLEQRMRRQGLRWG